MARKFLGLTLGLIFSFSLIFLGPATSIANDSPKYEWKFAVPWTSPHLQPTYEMFTTLVEAYTGGELSIKIFPNGQLGNHSEVFKGVRKGEIEIAELVPYASLVPGGVCMVPWATSSFDEFSLAFGAPDGILFKILDKAWGEVNMHQLWAQSGGGYGIGNNVRPLKTPADLKNLKIRVSQSKAAVDCLRNMGEGTGMTMEDIPWAELYNSLSRGVVDGCWSTFSLLVAERQYEVLKYFTPINFLWDSSFIVCNKEKWESLPKEYQDAVTRAAKEAELHVLGVQRRRLMDNQFNLASNGSIEIYSLSPEEKDQWFKASKVELLWDELAKPWLDEAFPGEDMTSVLREELKSIRSKASYSL